MRAYEEIIEALTGTEKIDAEIANLQDECEDITRLIRSLIDENARIAQDQETYRHKYGGMVDRYETVKREIDRLDAEKLRCFLDRLRRFRRLINDFDESLLCATVETVTVYTGGDSAVTFRDGSEILFPPFCY